MIDPPANLADLQRRIAAANLPGLPDDPAAFERLSQIFALRARWGKTHNLVGPRASRDPWSRDVLDAVATLAALHPTLPLWDVGAGAGVPGLLVAALAPEREVHLVEPRTKRTAFLSAAMTRALPSLGIHRGRWPLPLTEDAQVVSRAVVTPAEWPTLAASAGPYVCAVLRLLAAERPGWALPGYALAFALDYVDGDGVSLRVERWDRSIPA